MNTKPVVDCIKLAVIFSVCIAYQGCANSIETEASDIGMVALTLKGAPFKHRVYSLPAESESSTPVVFLLVDGDGRAFINPTTVAADPTPEFSSLLALSPDLAELGDVFYLGRPCYHRMNDPQCNPILWTLARYSQTIIDSSVSAARQLIQKGDRVILLGYSGGGVIAMLMARLLHPQVAGVVTFGSPLDTDAWTSFHGYTRLALSENPASDPDSFSNFCQAHLFGNRDQIVPEELFTSWRWHSTHPASIVSSDHSCCWQSAVLNAARSLIETCAAD